MLRPLVWEKRKKRPILVVNSAAKFRVGGGFAMGAEDADLRAGYVPSPARFRGPIAVGEA